MTVLSFRLSRKEIDRIKEIAIKENKKKGEATRSLLNYGWLFFNLNHYKEGRISLETPVKRTQSQHK